MISSFFLSEINAPSTRDISLSLLEKILPLAGAIDGCRVVSDDDDDIQRAFFSSLVLDFYRISKFKGESHSLPFSPSSTMDMFVFALVFLIVSCILLHFYTRQVQQQSKDPNFRSFQQTYLVVYLLAVGNALCAEKEPRSVSSRDRLAGDWLQGPHVYALYESYGIQKHEIEVLFIAGFGSSMIFGTIIASLADK